MKPELSKEFLFEYFSGNATSIQKQLIENWIRDAGNEDIFYRYLEEWERLHPQYIVDVRKGILHFNALLKQPATNEEIKEFPTPKRRTKTIWLQAASVAIAVISLAWFLYGERILYQTFHTLAEETTPCLLPDGSKVTLHSDSEIKVSRLWKLTGHREVFLSGDAEFDVAKNELARKFTVKTGNNVDITVHGTVFTVSNRHQRTAVALNEGKIQLTHHVGDSTRNIDMVPGDRIVVEAHHKTVIEERGELSEDSASRQHRFEFSQTSLEHVAEILKDYYQLEAVFEDSGIRSLTLTGSFVSVNAEELLESVCLMTGLTYRKNDQIVHFNTNKP